MRVALADTDQAALTEASTQLINMQVSANDILTCVTNVSNIAEVQAFKDAIITKFGEVLHYSIISVFLVLTYFLFLFFIFLIFSPFFSFFSLPSLPLLCLHRSQF
jgi:hypothetical protein